MMMASGRWFGVRLDAIISLLIGLVVLVAVLVYQDAGMWSSNQINYTVTRSCTLLKACDIPCDETVQRIFSCVAGDQNKSFSNNSIHHYLHEDELRLV